MLKVSTNKKAEPLRLDLGGGSALVLRKADSFDQIAAESEALRIVGAIEEGRDALAEFLLGPEDGGAERDRGALIAVITEIEIAMRVVSGLENIELDDVVQNEKSRALFAALFREPWILNAFRAKTRGDLHVRTLQGNGSAPSPIGEGKEAPPSAGTAASSNRPAPMDGAAPMESSAPSESMAS
jgi:hypothetical protein